MIQSVQQPMPQSDMLNDKELLACGKRIKNRFIELKRKRTGNAAYSVGKRHDQQIYWLNAAALAKKIGISPESFVDACFEYDKRPGGPFANNLFGRVAEMRAIQWKERVSQTDNVELSDVQEFFADLSDCLRAVSCNCKGLPPSSNEGVKFLLRKKHDYNAAVLVVAGYPNPNIRPECAAKAKEFFELHPNVLSETIGPKAAAALMEWLEEELDSP